MTPSEIENEINALKERNKRVEADKAWEGSWTRKMSIMTLTYIVAVVWLFLINEQSVSLKAMVPVLGYFLSTMTIPQIKKLWVK